MRIISIYFLLTLKLEIMRMFIDSRSGVVFFKNSEGTLIECPKGFMVVTHSGSTEETLIGPRAMMGGKVLGPNKAGLAPAGLPGLPPLCSSSKYYSDCEGTGFLLSEGFMYRYLISVSSIDQYSKSWGAWVKFVPFGTKLQEQAFENPNATAEGSVGGWCKSLSIDSDPMIPEFGVTVIGLFQAIRKFNRDCRKKTLLEFEESPSLLLESIDFSVDEAKYNKSAKVIAIGDEAELVVLEGGANMGFSDTLLVGRHNDENAHGGRGLRTTSVHKMGSMGWVDLGFQGIGEIMSRIPRGSKRYDGMISTMTDPSFVENEGGDVEVEFSIPKRCLGFISKNEGENYLHGIRGRVYGFITEFGKAIMSPQTILWLGQETEAIRAFSFLWGIPEDFEGSFIFHGDSCFKGEKFNNDILVSTFGGKVELDSWSLADKYNVFVKIKKETFDSIPEDFEGEFGFNGENLEFAIGKSGMTLTVSSPECKDELSFQSKFEVVVGDCGIISPMKKVIKKSSKLVDEIETSEED